MIIESFSGIRGEYSPALLDAAGRYAKAYAGLLRSKRHRPKIIIGRDSRSQGLAIQEKMCRVLSCEGVGVLLAGILPTPTVAFGVREFGLDGGIIITASHNPPEHNGWKLLQETGGVLTPVQSHEIIIEAKRAAYQEKECHPREIRAKLVKAYTRYLKKQVGEILPSNPVIFDPNGGAALPVLPGIIKTFGIKADIINRRMGLYSHGIEPTGAALETILPEVRKKNASFAFGFDCDADRVEIILSTGNLVSGNVILAIIVDLVLQDTRGPVVTNDATSLLIRDICRKHNCPLVEVEVGEANVVEKMNELKSPVGGEGSNGGVILPPGQCRDGVLTACLIMKVLGRRSLQDLLAAYQGYAQKTQKVACRPEDVPSINNLLEKIMKREGFLVVRHGDERGTVKGYKGDAFIFFRASRTEPGQFRIITDAKSEREAGHLLAAAMRIYRQSAKYLNHRHEKSGKEVDTCEKDRPGRSTSSSRS